MNDYVNGWLTELSEYIANMNGELEKTKAENAKLRELITGMWPYAQLKANEYCNRRTCPYVDECESTDTEYCMCVEWFERDMRNLGVDV